MTVNPKIETPSTEAARCSTAEDSKNAEADGAGCGCARLLTREELAAALKVSLRTVDRMLAEGEITGVRVHRTVVRFYLPDVVRQLVATALTCKRARGAQLRFDG